MLRMVHECRSSLKEYENLENINNYLHQDSSILLIVALRVESISEQLDRMCTRDKFPKGREMTVKHNR